MRPISLIHGFSQQGKPRTATRDKRPVPEVHFNGDAAINAARREEIQRREALERDAKRELERIVAREGKEREARERARRAEEERLGKLILQPRADNTASVA